MNLPPPITSRSNARVKALRAAFSGKASSPGDLVAIEGETLLSEAMRSAQHFDTVFIRQGSEAMIDRPALAGLAADHWAVLSPDVFASAVDTASPQGIAATLIIPKILSMELDRGPRAFLVLEDVQDPGNFGTLIRSAEAFLAAQIFVTPNTVNQWNPKVIRASAGSVFRMPIVRCPLADTKSFLDSLGVKLVAAVARETGATPVMHARLLVPCAMMIGNEGAGLSQQALALASERVHIPCLAESLNAAVAGSILLYESFRQNVEHEFRQVETGTLVQ